MPTIGLISDTHGLIRPECLVALEGVDLILHAGDVGGSHVLHTLAQVAPVEAVCGNVDPPGGGLPAAIRRDVDGVSVLVSHGHELGSPTPAALMARYRADVIVYGHTHRALVERHGRTLVINPGSAGPQRFRLVPSVARLTIRHGGADAAIVQLACPEP